MKKDSLIKGTLILAAAAIIARMLGVVQRVPLKALLGDYGMALYGIAYNIYFVLLIIATAGIPSALSKLISERVDTGRAGEAARIYRAAIVFAAAAGILMTALLIAVAPLYARMIDAPDATLAIQALAPALLLFPMIAIMRGYFQGMQFMTAGGLSQIVEQLLRVAGAVLLAWLLLLYGYGGTVAVAGASFGGVLGAVGAFGVMLYYVRRLRASSSPLALPDAGASNKQLSKRQAYRLIFAYSIPITFAALAVPLINVIDSSLVIPLLKNAQGLVEATVSLGILTGRAQSLAGIPIILAIALSQSALPVISSAFTRGDMDEVNSRASQAMWMSIVFGLGVVAAMLASVGPVNALLFGDTAGTVIIAGMIAASMLQIVMMTSTSILTGLGGMKKAAIHVYVGIAIKLAAIWLLAPLVGMGGVIGSTMLCFAVIVVLNMRAVRKDVRLRVLGRGWIWLLAAAVAAVAVGLLVGEALARWLTLDIAVVNHLLHGGIRFGLAGLTYGALLLLFKVVGKRHIGWLPGKLGRLLGKLAR